MVRRTVITLDEGGSFLEYHRRHTCCIINTITLSGKVGPFWSTP